MRPLNLPFNHVKALGANRGEQIVYALLGIYLVWSDVIHLAVAYIAFRTAAVEKAGGLSGSARQRATSQDQLILARRPSIWGRVEFSQGMMVSIGREKESLLRIRT
jgi:hypothetical protein